LRLRRPICTILLCCLVLGGCADSADQGTPAYVVRPQDTLYSIAWRHDVDFRDLARWNNIGPDFHIAVGQVLRLEPGTLAGANARPRIEPKAAMPAAPLTAPKTETPATRGAGQRWVWPTDRPRGSPASSGNGLLLGGVLGQDVRAASAGRVVYTGSGLRGYGNLIIIKHADSLLSAYAHNREMLVREGQDVAAGQVIAHMGEGAHQAPTLYFEIRQNGKPVNPLPFLPGTK
jgi:lipoprotein NlpD